MESIQNEKPKVINLSHKLLNDSEIDLLKKGLKFTPTPQYSNLNEIKDDISEFCRKLRLTEELFDKDNDDESIVRNKSDYNSPIGRNKHLDKFCEYISKFPYENVSKTSIQSNVSRKEWEIIFKLKNDNNLVIKEADKGSAVVLMDLEYYKNIALSMLNDNNFYVKCKNYKQSKIMRQLMVMIHMYRKGLTDKECDYLTNFKCKTSNFYGLPKIHKCAIINQACKETNSSYIHICSPNDLKLRPIIAGPSCETHRLSNFLDILLKPFLKHIPSFVRDDIDMLNHLPHHIDKDTILVSFDVVNLYTTIPHNYGLEAISFWLEKYPFELPDRIQKIFIIEGIKFILENNFFSFDDIIYKQISGTAMGTKMAPTYANLVMAYLENKMYDQCLVKYGNLFRNYVLKNWKRYLDDCFILWKESMEKLYEFKELINSLNDDIQFTMEFSLQQLPFLDILIIKKETMIETDIYFKPTDSKQYLLFTSCHPKHTRTNIPYNLARRICTIVSNTDTRDKRLYELKQILIERKYPIALINNGIQRARVLNIQDLRKTKEVTSSKVIPYISTYNPRNVEAFNVIHQNLPIIQNEPRIKQALENHRIIKSKRQPKSLKKLLTSAKLTTEEKFTVKKCGRSNCGICLNLIEGSNFEFKSGIQFTVKNNFTCASGNLIYVIKCSGCHQEYIGQTGLPLRKRMTVHRQQINDPSTRQIPVSEHLDTCAANIRPKYRLFPLYQFPENSTQQTRVNKETLFIKKYRPQLNK